MRGAWVAKACVVVGQHGFKNLGQNRGGRVCVEVNTLHRLDCKVFSVRFQEQAGVLELDGVGAFS